MSSCLQLATADAPVSLQGPAERRSRQWQARSARLTSSAKLTELCPQLNSEHLNSISVLSFHLTNLTAQLRQPCLPSLALHLTFKSSRVPWPNSCSATHSIRIRGGSKKGAYSYGENVRHSLADSLWDRPASNAGHHVKGKLSEQKAAFINSVTGAYGHL